MRLDVCLVDRQHTGMARARLEEFQRNTGHQYFSTSPGLLFSFQPIPNTRRASLEVLNQVFCSRPPFMPSLPLFDVNFVGC